MQPFQYCQAGVQADQIGECQRAHRLIGTELHALIDVVLDTRQCFVGAVKDVILTHADPHLGFELCRRLDDGMKDACYAASGEVLISLYADQLSRDSACEAVEAAYVDTCKASAVRS